MLPEVEAYFAGINTNGLYPAIRQAERENPLPDWSPSFSEAERAAYYQADTLRAEAVRKVDHAWKEIEATAVRGLLNSDNSLVRWIGEQPRVRSDYPEQVEAVLRALPMTREELEDFGAARGWCGEYTRLYRIAERAGVLPEYAPPLADIEPLTEELTAWYSDRHGGASERKFRNMINKHLPAILKSAQGKAAGGGQQQEQAAA